MTNKELIEHDLKNFKNDDFMRIDPKNAHHLYKALSELAKIHPDVFSNQDRIRFMEAFRSLKLDYLRTGVRHNYWHDKANRKSYLNSMLTVKYRLKTLTQTRRLSAENLYKRARHIIDSQTNFAAKYEINDKFVQLLYMDPDDGYAHSLANVKQLVPGVVYILDTTVHNAIVGAQVGDAAMVRDKLNQFVKYLDDQIRAYKNHQSRDYMADDLIDQTCAFEHGHIYI